jgi:hypothetical protein
MQLIKIVISFLAVGGTGYALFRFSHDAPAWVKVLGLVAGIATLIGAITILPQALDALEQSAERLSRWISPSEEQLRRRAEEDAKRRSDEEARRSAAEEVVLRQRQEEENRMAAARAKEQEAKKKVEADAQRRADEEAAKQAKRRADEEARAQSQREEDRRRQAAIAERQRLTEIVRRDRCQATAVCPAR